MNDTMIPPADEHDTDRPAPGEDITGFGTLPPFASEKRVSDLEKRLEDIQSMLGEAKALVTTCTNRVSEFSEDIRRLVERQNRLAGRVAVLDGEEEAIENGEAT